MTSVTKTDLPGIASKIPDVQVGSPPASPNTGGVLSTIFAWIDAAYLGKETLEALKRRDGKTATFAAARLMGTPYSLIVGTTSSIHLVNTLTPLGAFGNVSSFVNPIAGSILILLEGSIEMTFFLNQLEYQHKHLRLAPSVVQLQSLISQLEPTKNQQKKLKIHAKIRELHGRLFCKIFTSQYLAKMSPNEHFLYELWKPIIGLMKSPVTLPGLSEQEKITLINHYKRSLLLIGSMQLIHLYQNYLVPKNEQTEKQDLISGLSLQRRTSTRIVNELEKTKEGTPIIFGGNFPRKPVTTEDLNPVIHLVSALHVHNRRTIFLQILGILSLTLALAACILSILLTAGLIVIPSWITLILVISSFALGFTRSIIKNYALEKEKPTIKTIIADFYQDIKGKILQVLSFLLKFLKGLRNKILTPIVHDSRTFAKTPVDLRILQWPHF